MTLLIFFLFLIVAMARAMIAITRFGVVLASPAVSAKVFFREADSLDQVVNALERKRREVQLLADVFDHVLVRLAIRIGVLVEIGVFTFLVANVTARDEVVFI